MENIDDHRRSSITESMKNIDDHPKSSILEANNDIYEHPRSSILEAMKNIASKPNQDNPFYILELECIVHRVQQFRRLLPRVEVFYGVKCNDHGDVLDTLASLGVNFDCFSKREISNVMGLGVNPSRIIYSHPCKTKLDLEFASRVQVSLITFASKEELIQIQEIYPKAELILKVSFQATFNCNQDIEFGTSVEDSTSLISLARDMNLRVVGVSIRVETQYNGTDVYRRSIAAAQQIFYKGKTFGMDMNLLDIGVGFTGRHNWDFENFTSVINEALNTYFNADKNPSLRVIAEPSRYMVTSAFTLCTRIITKKKAQLNNQTTNMYYVNAGLFNAFMDLVEESVPLCPRVLLSDEGRSDLESAENSTFWGPTCCPLDVLQENINFPSLGCGDWIYWSDMGAFTLAFSTEFNGFPVPKIHVIRM